MTVPTREELVAELEAAMEALTPIARLGAEGSKVKQNLKRLQDFMDRVYEGQIDEPNQHSRS